MADATQGRVLSLEDRVLGIFDVGEKKSLVDIKTVLRAKGVDPNVTAFTVEILQNSGILRQVGNISGVYRLTHSGERALRVLRGTPG